MGESETARERPPAEDALKFEVSQGRDSAIGVRRTEGGSIIPFRQWFEQIHWLVVLVSGVWFLCLCIVAYSANDYGVSGETSTAYLALIMGSLSFVGSGLMLLSGLVHYSRGKVKRPTLAPDLLGLPAVRVALSLLLSSLSLVRRFWE
jgi:hypothetical protein